MNTTGSPRRGSAVSKKTCRSGPATPSRGARVSGSIRSYDFAETGIIETVSPPLVEAGGFREFRVELSCAADTLRRSTDARGEFLLPHVRPGEWVVRITGGHLPSNHFLKPDSIGISVRARDTRKALFRDLPRRRVVHILEEGKLRVEPEKKPAPPSSSTQGKAAASSSPLRTGAVPSCEHRFGNPQRRPDKQQI